MNVKPVLGDWEIPRIEAIDAFEQRRFVELEVPGRAGSLYQDLNLRPAWIGLRGSLFGDETRNDFLEALREKFRAGEPVTFVADILTATEVQYVVIETLAVAQSGSHPDQMDYRIVLRESPPPPPPPDPFSGIDTGLLGDAASLLDSVTGALDALEMLGAIPDISDPTPPLRETLSGVGSALTGLADVAGSLSNLFGESD
ncbi:MAG: hypothetical protein WAK57_00345 [Desulfobacterales bacterium]